MLSLDTPLSGSYGLCLEDFWQLPVSKEFDQPEYYIGQSVFHVIKEVHGEILCPVKVIGVSWSGINWEYLVEIPESHPKFEHEDCELMWLEDWQLEGM